MGKNNQKKIEETINAIKEAYNYIDMLNGVLCELQEEYQNHNIAFTESEASVVFDELYIPMPTYDTMNRALEILKDSYNRTGEEFTCGNCGKIETYEPALSRKDNKTTLCSECAMEEALG